MIHRLLLAGLLLLAAGTATATCASYNHARGWQPPRVVDAGGESIDFDTLVDRVRDERIVYVGEIHDRHEHHQVQLEILCRLASGVRPLALAMEYFETPFQAALDAFVHEHRDLDRLLAESEYFRRWRFDFRLYAPILEFAADHGIELVALNAPLDTVRAVARDGLDGAPPTIRERLARHRAALGATYRNRLAKAFEQHPGSEHQDSENFLLAQLLRDETMAERAAAFLEAHPRHRLLVLAGGGHVDVADAVPERVERRTALRGPRIVQSLPADVVGSPGLETAFVLEPRSDPLPAPGRIGIELGSDEAGIHVAGFAASSAGRDAGLARGDRLLRIDGRPIGSLEDVRIALWRKPPGTQVDVVVERDGEQIGMQFELG